MQKEALISLAVFGEGNTYVESNDEYKEVFNSFQKKLETILPDEIGFKQIRINMPDVIWKQRAAPSHWTLCPVEYPPCLARIIHGVSDFGVADVA